MKKIFIAVILLFTINVCYAQHLTYSEFVETTNMKSVSELSDFFQSRGYKYKDGGKIFSKEMSDSLNHTVWCKECYYLSSIDKFEKNDPDTPCSWFSFQFSIEKDVFIYSYLCPNISDFKSFLEGARNDGFEPYEVHNTWHGTFFPYFKRNDTLNCFDCFVFDMEKDQNNIVIFKRIKSEE